MNASKHSRSTDGGFSLTELAVYILVLGIISAVIATVMVSLFRSEQTVSAVTTASNDSQVISTILANDIRNARAFHVSSNEVIASVASGDSPLKWNCVRWVGSATDKSLTRQVMPENTAPTWSAGTVLATGIERVSEGPYFAFAGGGPEDETSHGTKTGSLRYSFAIPTSGEASLTVTGYMSNRVAAPGSKCW